MKMEHGDPGVQHVGVGDGVAVGVGVWQPGSIAHGYVNTGTGDGVGVGQVDPDLGPHMGGGSGSHWTTST
jgi:hypothetical protein